MFRVFEMYRQEAAALILPLLLAWLTGDSSEALSTFGVSNTKPPSAVPTTPPGKDFLYNGTFSHSTHYTQI